MMSSECGNYLQSHIQGKCKKEPDTTTAKVKSWILSGKPKYDLSAVTSKTLTSFLDRNSQKFKETDRVRRKGDLGGSNKISAQAATCIKRLSLNRKSRGRWRRWSLSHIKKDYEAAEE